MEEDTCERDFEIRKGGWHMWVLGDIVLQYVFGIVFCAIIFCIWKITHKGKKLGDEN